VPFGELTTDYPFLTGQLLDEAEAHLKHHSPTGRPQRVAEVYPDLNLINEMIVRPEKSRNRGR
jgi:hypothetical protein